MGKIGIATDIHLGHGQVDNQDIISEAEELAYIFAERDVDAVFLLGDQIHEQSPSKDKSNLETIYEIFGNIGEFHALIGNHDVGCIDVEDFEQIMQSPVNRLLSIDGTDIVMLDTGSVNDIQNIGEISEEGMDVCESVEEPVIFTHFPITYTDTYQDSPFFGTYPEGVFAINKYHFEERRNSGRLNPERIVCGHLHLKDTYEDRFGCSNHILSPFIDLVNEEVDGTGFIFDLDDGSFEEVNSK